MGKVKKSKRWGGEWTRVGKRGKGVPRPNVGLFTYIKIYIAPKS